MTPHDTIRLFTKTLENLEKWMDKAGEHAKARSFDVDVLAQARLAPDQFRFVQQVQAACDQAKYAAAYLGGKPAPSHPDTEKTFAELRERIRKCTGFLATVQARGPRRRRRAEGGPALARGPLAPRRRLPRARGRAELLLPRHDGLRHPASQRSAARQDGLHRLAADARGLSRRSREG